MPVSARSVIPLAVLAGAVYLLYLVNTVLLPFILAAAQAFLFNPIVRFFEVRGFRRGPVVILFYLALVAVTSLAAYRLAVVAAGEARKASVMMPVYMAKGSVLLENWKDSARRAGSPTHQKTIVEKTPVLRDVILNPTLIASVERRAREWPEQILERMPSFASGMLPLLEMVVLVPFIGFFLMWEGPRLRDTVLGWLPSRYVEMALNLFVELDNSLGRYLRGICLEALCIGCLAYAGFQLIGLDYALQIAVVAGIANLVPYMGPIVSGVAAGGVALMQGGGLPVLLQVLLVCLALRVIDDFLIQPTVLRSAVHLHPVWIVFSLMAGAKLFGFWGLLFGVPVASMIKVLLQVGSSWYRLRYGLAPAQPHPEINRIPLV